MTVGQIASAMAALGLYEGNSTPAEHAEYAAQVGGAGIHRVRLLNALLGAVQREAMLADEVETDEENEYTAWAEQLKSAKAWDGTLEQLAFARWQTRRAGRPMEVIAQSKDTGPLPVATAYTSEALQVLLGSFGALYAAFEAEDVQAAAAQAEVLERARESLQSAMENTDLMLDQLRSIGR
ncbi:DUF6245 family protein [Kitasatospora sp. NPDC090091]|uniref:DUF6245 family protein n=1 Tax=Kitasatospora sp. NPDC090091 TaxID=3364081 RepID=UPI0038048299